MTDSGWIGAVLTSARPQAVAAVLRYFRKLDAAEAAHIRAQIESLSTTSAKRGAK